MKTIIPALFLIIVSIELNAQQYSHFVHYASRKNAISAVYTCEHMGFGLRYDAGFIKYGLYASATYGTYKAPKIKTMNHLKISVGVTKQIRQASIGMMHLYCFAGLKIDSYSKAIYKNPSFPFSFEVGIGTDIKDRFICGFGYDPIKSDSEIHLGLKF